MEDENERAVESYSEEDLEREREEDLEEIEEMIVKALRLDEGPNFEDKEDVIEWFEELDEDELEELREYQLEQMPDSNGCGLTNYEEGPNEREDDLTDDEPLGDIPNGHGSNPPPDGGTYGNHVPCTEDESPYDYLYECLDEHSNAECDVICHGNEDYGGGDYDYSEICDLTCNMVCTSSWIVIGYSKCVATCTGATLGFGAKPCAVVCGGIATAGCWLGCDTICDSF